MSHHPLHRAMLVHMSRITFLNKQYIISDNHKSHGLTFLNHQLSHLVCTGYHVLTSSALKTKGVDPLVFALYRELSASLLIAGLAAYAVHKGGHK